jgi:hypothetical protein
MSPGQYVVCCSGQFDAFGVQRGLEPVQLRQWHRVSGHFARAIEWSKSALVANAARFGYDIMRRIGQYSLGIVELVSVERGPSEYGIE